MRLVTCHTDWDEFLDMLAYLFGSERSTLEHRRRSTTNLAHDSVWRLGWMAVLLFKPPHTSLVDASRALPGRERPVEVAERHVVLGTPLTVGGDQVPTGIERAVFGMGCFWGAERVFWQAPGVYTTAVGYAGGFTPNPTYEEVCSGQTGHAEVVLVAFDPAQTSFQEMLRLFWEGHDPTQGMRQGNDAGTQYRSMVLWESEAQRELTQVSREAYQRMLSTSGHGEITTEIEPGGAEHPFYYAEDYHQQYLAKNPGAYCGAGGTGVACPVGLTSQQSTHPSSH
jgi:peptide-methionine (S)-S-oxide reductase